MEFFHIFLLLLTILISKAQKYGIQHLNGTEFVGIYNQLKMDHSFVFLAFTGYPCKICDNLIYSMNVASMHSANDLDLNTTFLNLNVTRFPEILEIFDIKMNSFPKIFMMFPLNNYSLVEFNEEINFYNFLKAIKTYMPTSLLFLNSGNELNKRINQSSEIMIFGLFTQTNSDFFLEYNKTTEAFNFIKTYYSTNQAEFQFLVDKRGYQDDIYIIRNPYLYGYNQDYLSFKNSTYQNISDFIINSATSYVEICSPPIFKIYSMKNLSIFMFVFAPKYQKEGLIDLILNLERTAKNYESIKFCVSISGFDSPSLRYANIKAAGEALILNIDGSVYKNTNYLIYKNKKINDENLRQFLNDYLDKKIQKYFIEEEKVDLEIERSINLIDSRRKFQKFIQNKSKMLLLYLYEGKARPSVFKDINNFTKILGNYSENLSVGVVDTKIATLEDTYLKYGNHDIFLFRRANSSEIMAYRGQRDSQSLYEFIEYEINEQIKKGIKEIINKTQTDNIQNEDL